MAEYVVALYRWQASCCFHPVRCCPWGCLLGLGGGCASILKDRSVDISS